MADFLDGSSFHKIMQADEDTARKIGPQLPFLVRVQSLVQHGLHGNFVGAD